MNPKPNVTHPSHRQLNLHGVGHVLEQDARLHSSAGLDTFETSQVQHRRQRRMAMLLLAALIVALLKFMYVW